MMDAWDFLNRYLFYVPTNLHDVMDHTKGVMSDLGQAADYMGTVAGLSADDKKELEYLSAQVPILGDLIGARDDYNYITDYMSNTGLSWSDLEYPTHVRGAGLGLGGTYSFVSKNLADLYR